jgi:toxin ParE1/3/4
MLKKETIIKKANELPNEVDANQLDTLFNELLFNAELDRRSESVWDGNTTRHEEVVCEDSALLGLDDSHDFISRDSNIYASRELEKLETNPLLGKYLRDSKRSTTHELVEGNYRIIYEIASNHTVFIVYVLHGARDLNNRREN